MRRLILLCLLFILTACATDEPSQTSQAALSTAPVEQTSENVPTEESSALVATETVPPTALPTETALPLPTQTPLPLPTQTALPLPTQTPLPLPTQTALPTETALPLPTQTALPTETALPLPTQTALPTETPLPLPTQTAFPTETPLPLPTQTALPLPTETAFATNTLLPTETALPFLTETPLPPPTEPPPATFTAQPAGTLCQRPPDDYRRVEIWVSQLSRRPVISQRTLAMLENAQALYGGIGSMQLIIQGSYAAGLGASFGTHDAGGAVDIWTVDPNNTNILLNDIENMVWALRQSGFAAWFRPKDMLYVGMYPHIHAIAIGDSELSGAAAAQLTGDEAYFRGRNGLPDAQFMGWDPHGGPILCPWMQEMGYQLLPYPNQEGANNDTSESTQSENEPSESEQAEASTTAVACQKPVDDYSRTLINGYTLNQRTYSMLQTAQALYGGPGDLLRVTQGSYTGALAASFGTHEGGGAVDISIRHPQTSQFLYDETGRMVQALRQAGFAAWYRSPDQGFAPHIHAIAIGDTELSAAAAAQLTGEQGYFRGRNALPDERAGADPHGGAWICDWMIAAGYQDLR